MAKGYRPVDRMQPFLLPPDMRDWLPANDPVWLVIEIIEQHLDTSAFHAGRKVGGVGRAGYHPDMVLTLLVWGWTQGLHSSRRIERLCSQDLSFRVICAGDAPDHVTIARFRQGFAAAVESFFAEVLVLCRRLGLGQVGVVALDGTKIASPASSSQNRTEEGLRQAADAEQARQAAREAAARHAATDAEEDARFGDQRGDEMSEEPPKQMPASGAGSSGSSGSSGGRSRSERIAAAMADLQAEREQAVAEQAEQAAKRQARMDAKGGGGLPGRPPAGSELVVAEQGLAQARAEVAERQVRWQQSGKGRNPYPGGVEGSFRVRQAVARLERTRQLLARREAKQAARKPSRGPVRNITDPQSRPQPLAGGGWLQGYNAQAVGTVDGIVLATSLSNSQADSPAFTPLLQAAAEAAERMGAGPIGTVVADAGYLTVDNLTADGPDRLIAVGKRCDLEQAARAGEQPEGLAFSAEPIEAMKARLATPAGIATYRQRGHIIETVFGHGKHNWDFLCFTGRGLQRAQAEWTFHGAVHNLAKIITRAAAQPDWRTSG